MPNRLLPLRIADILMLLIKQPRTARELSDLSGMDITTVRRYLAAFTDEGLVKKQESRRGRIHFIYTWAPYPLQSPGL